jgi:hypothetical protein
MGAGYGMVQQGIFRAPYALTRGLYGGGGNQDPLAALIGSALGTYQAGHEKDINDALMAKREQDEADWRRYQVGASAAEKGLTATAPLPTAPPNIPVGPPPESAAGMGPSGPSTSLNLRQPNLALAQPAVAPTPVVPAVGKYPALYRDIGARLKEYQPVGGGEGAFDPYTGKVTPTGFTPLGKQPGYHIEFSDDGSGTGRQVGKWVPDVPPAPGTPANVVTVPGLTHEPGQKPTPQQGEKAEFGAGALAAWQSIEKERTQNPQVEAEVGKILASPTFVQAIPGFRSSADMVKLLKTAGASDAAQRYLRAKWSFMDNVIRTRIPGGRMSGALFTTMAGEFLPSLDPAANSQIRTNEIQSIISAQGESGYDLNPETWNRAVKRHGVANVDLQAALAGGPSDARLNRIRGRY